VPLRRADVEKYLAWIASAFELMRQRLLATLFIALFVSSAGLSRFAAAGNTVGLDRQTELGGEANKRSPRIRPEAGLIRYGSGNWRTLTNTRRYGVFIVGPANANAAGAQPGRALIYGCGVSIPNASWSASCGVSWREAVANNWLLKDANGKYVPYGHGYSNEYLADIGNSSYRQRFISEMDADIAVHRGVDGVFIDNVVGNLISSSNKYRDNASYRLAMLGFIKSVGPALRARGRYVAVNAGMNDDGARAFTGETNDGTQYIWWFKQIGPYVSGISTEHWQQWGSTGSVRTSGTAWNQAWEGWERLPSAVASMGKDFYAITTGALTDTREAAYLRASFLLAWKPGRGTFFYTDSSVGKSDPWGLVATPDIGRPLGPRRRIGVGFKRTFTSGIAVVNPSPSQSQTFGFHRKYLMADGTTTRSITLPPTSGLVLRRASLR
jgi:hypothetical protein